MRHTVISCHDAYLSDCGPPSCPSHTTELLIVISGLDRETNDGGVVNDKQMRAFAASCLSTYAKIAQAAEQGTCTSDGCHGDDMADKNLWQRMAKRETGVTDLVTINPAFGEGLRGVRILQQTVPFRISKVKV